MRLFIAINFSQETLNFLLELQNRLRDQVESCRTVSLENLHLTLAFLGECDQAATSRATSCLDEQRFAPLAIQLESLGYFPPRAGQMESLWWVGLRRTPELLAVQSSLANDLRRVGFTLEKRPFQPHVTLARRVIVKDVAGLVQQFAAHGLACAETARSLALMESQLLNGHRVYNVRHTVMAQEPDRGVTR